MKYELDEEYRYKIARDVSLQFWRNLWVAIKRLLKLN